MMLNVMILEDCSKNRLVLETIIRSISDSIHVFSASALKEAKELLKKGIQFDLFFLDINLSSEQNNEPDYSGLTFAKELREIGGYEFTPVVFVTSIAELEIPAYRETACYRYLIKPYQKEEVREVIRKALHSKSQRDGRQITIKKDGVNFRIPTIEILCLKAVPRGTELILREESVFVKYRSLKQMLEELMPEPFVQCHRMFAVNTLYIEYVDLVNGMIKLQGLNEPVEIGVTYKSRMRSLLK